MCHEGKPFGTPATYFADCSSALVKVTPAGLAHLNKLSNLLELSVSGQLVGPEGIRQLQQFSELRNVYFGQTDDPRATAVELKRAMPSVGAFEISKLRNKQGQSLVMASFENGARALWHGIFDELLRMAI